MSGLRARKYIREIKNVKYIERVSCKSKRVSQQIFTCSESTIETKERAVKFLQR